MSDIVELSDDSNETIICTNDQSHTNKDLSPHNKKRARQEHFQEILSDSSSDDQPQDDVVLQMLTEKYKKINTTNIDVKTDKIIARESKKQEKELVKLQKAEEREQKKRKVEQEKALKQALATTNKNAKPVECMKFITVKLDDALIGEEFGQDLVKALQDAQINFITEAQLFSHTITWTRQRQMHSIDDGGQLILNAQPEETDEILLIMNCRQFVQHINNNTLTAHIQSLKSILINKTFTLAIFGLQSYVRYQKNKQQAEFRNNLSGSEGHQIKNSNTFNSFPAISKREIELALTELQLVCRCSHRLIETTSEVGLLVTQFTKSIAELPFKHQKNEKYQQTDWFAAGDNRDCVKVDKNGNGLQRLWNQMLTSFPLARLETAEAISAKYPTLASLIMAYENCDVNAGELLLQDIPVRRAAGPLTSSRKVGPELSRKIYHFFTSLDGDILL